MPSRIPELLSDDRRAPDALLSLLEDLSREGIPAFSGAVGVLTGLELDEQEARTLLGRILDHRAGLAGRLSRDPGLRVATADLLLNVDRTTEGLVPGPVFEDLLDREVRRGRRFQHPVGLLVLDLEGTPGGEADLPHALRAARRALRSSDTACRPGPRELRILLTETGRSGACAAARRVEAAVREASGGRLAVRGGAAGFPEDAGDAPSLAIRAEEARTRAHRPGEPGIVPSGAEVLPFPGGPA